MTKVYTFCTVLAKDAALAEEYGPMIVREIRTPEEAEHYGSFEIMCRSLKNGHVIDFAETELLVIEK